MQRVSTARRWLFYQIVCYSVVCAFHGLISVCVVIGAAVGNGYRCYRLRIAFVHGWNRVTQRPIVVMRHVHIYFAVYKWLEIAHLHFKFRFSGHGLQFSEFLNVELFGVISIAGLLVEHFAALVVDNCFHFVAFFNFG